jgi:hypothetical protein
MTLRDETDDNYSSHLFLRQYKDAVIHHVKTTYSEWRLLGPSPPVVLYLTIAFNGRTCIPNAHNVSEATHEKVRLDYVNGLFNRAYNSLLQHMFGGHFERKKRQQPIAWTFMDLPGSKTRRRCASKRGCPTARLGLHIHCILMLHPCIKWTEDQARSTVEKAIKAAIAPSINSLDVQIVSQDRIDEQLGNLVGYSIALMFRRLRKMAPTDLIEYYPKFRNLDNHPTQHGVRDDTTRSAEVL